MSLDSKTKELIYLGAATACNCLYCFQYHYNKCLELGIPVDNIKEAVELARTVKSVPVKKLDELAVKLI